MRRSRISDEKDSFLRGLGEIDHAYGCIEKRKSANDTRICELSGD